MKTLRIALLGHGFMGRAHSHAFRTVASFFPDVAPPELAVLCGRDAAGLARTASAFGWKETSTDWRAVVRRPDIDVVDVSTPGDLHAPMAIAALAAGKHVICEKPLANDLSSARRMARAAERAGTTVLCAFNYRRVPAIVHARRLIEDGALGRILHFRARYLQDWILDPAFPLVWRLDGRRAGSGPHGDLNAHITDLALHLVGPIASVAAMTETFVRRRPLPAAAGRTRASRPRATGRVTVEDAALFLARFRSGALASFEATRMAAGRKNHLALEINGEKGSLTFDLERLNELGFCAVADDPLRRGFRTILVTEPGHPYLKGWWPPGHMLGWEHTFTHEIADFLRAAATGRAVAPDFRDGARCQAVLDAALRSAATGRTVAVPRV